MDDSYNLYDGCKRGLAYIIVNQKFTGHDKRIGAKKDYQNMKKAFSFLGFKLIPFMNKTAKEIETILKEASQRKDLQHRSSFVCVISTHGGERSVGHSGKTAKHEHFVVGSDSQDVETRTLIDMFSSSNCRVLKDKPKLFFIQACRTGTDESKMYDDGIEVKMIKYKKDLLKKRKQVRRDVADDASFNQDDGSLPTQKCPTSTSDVNRDVEDGDPCLDKYLSEEYIIDTTDDESDGEDECRDKTKVKAKHPIDTPVTKRSDIKELVGKKREVRSETKSKDATDTNAKTKDKGKKSDTFAVEECPCHDDMIIMFASTSGQTAWRDECLGGWLLFNLHLVVLDHICADDIVQTNVLSLLTEVSRKVSFWVSDTVETISTGKMMIPVMNHKLTKQIYFRAKKWDVFMSKLKKKLF